MNYVLKGCPGGRGQETWELDPGKEAGATTLWALAWTGQGLTQRSRGGVEGDDLCLSVSFKTCLLSTSSVQGRPCEGEPDVSLNLGKCTVL